MFNKSGNLAPNGQSEDVATRVLKYQSILQIGTISLGKLYLEKSTNILCAIVSVSLFIIHLTIQLKDT